MDTARVCALLALTGAWGASAHADQPGGKAPSNRAPTRTLQPADITPATRRTPGGPAEAAPEARPLPEGLLIGADGRGAAARELAFRGDAVAIITSDGASRLIPLGAAPVTLFDPFTPRVDVARSEGMLVLVDGQRLRGMIDPAPAGPERVGWRSPLLGRLVVPFERVAEIRLSESDSHSPLGSLGAGDEPSADVVTLVNGDRINGVVTGIDAVCSIEPFDGVPIDLPVDRVAGVRFVSDRGEAAAPTVWLRDGTRLIVDEMRPLDAGRIALRRGGDTLAIVSRGALTALTASTRGLAPFSDAAMVSEIVDARRWRPEPARLERPSHSGAFDGPDVVIPGATRMRIEAPPGAVALLARAAVVGDEQFASARVTVWVDRRPVATLDLDHGSPEAMLLAPLERRDFLLTVVPPAPGHNASPVRLIEPVFVMGRPNPSPEGGDAKGDDR